MSLRDALLKNKQRLDEMKIEVKIQKMLEQQSKLLEEYSSQQSVIAEIHEVVEVKDKQTKKPNYNWDESILGVNGGVSYFTIKGVDGKGDKRYRVANTGVECDTILKFHIRTSTGSRFSVSAKSYSEAQKVVDEVFGKGLYKVSASLL